MDNRDKNIRCTYYTPGAKYTTKNKRIIGQRKRTINCRGGTAYYSMRFKTIQERAEFNKRYCKRNCGCCPIFNCIEQMDDKGV